MKTETTLKLVFRYALAISIVIGFFWLLGNVAKITIAPDMRDTLIFIIGVLVSKFSTIVDYEWGTSRSSSEKNATIKDALDKSTEANFKPTSSEFPEK